MKESPDRKKKRKKEKDECIWHGCGKVQVLWSEYLELAVNALTNSAKILNLTKRDNFQLYVLQDDEKLE